MTQQELLATLIGEALLKGDEFAEIVKTALVRTGRLATAAKVGKVILGSEEGSILPLVKLIRVDEEIFARAWQSFKSKRFEGLSFTNHTVLAQLKKFGIDTLVSFDTAFDGLARRIS